jgi:hypothetical protein
VRCRFPHLAQGPAQRRPAAPVLGSGGLPFERPVGIPEHPGRRRPPQRFSARGRRRDEIAASSIRVGGTYGYPELPRPRRTH